MAKEKEAQEGLEDIEALKAENVALKASSDALKAENEALKAAIEELNAALAVKDSEIKASSKRPIIKHGKDLYELRISKFVYKYNGNNVVVDEALLNADKKLVAELIEKDKGVLIKKGGK